MPSLFFFFKKNNIFSHCPATLSLFRHSLLQPPHWDLEKGVFCLLPAPTVFTNSYGQQLPIFHGATPLTSEQCVGLPLATAAQLRNAKALPSLYPLAFGRLRRRHQLVSRTELRSAYGSGCASLSVRYWWSLLCSYSAGVPDDIPKKCWLMLGVS